MKQILLIIIAFSFTGCGLIYPSLQDSKPPEDTFTSEVLRNARKIIYVSPTGNDKTKGTKHTPLASIQKAINIAQKGDAVKVEPGTYTGNIRLRSGVSLVGSGHDKTTLTARTGNILTAQDVLDVTIEGFTLDGQHDAEHGLFCNCVNIYNRTKTAQMVTFRKNTVKNFTDNGIHGEMCNILYFQIDLNC